jgi:hypothetical protein
LDKDAETICLVRLAIDELQPLVTCKVLLTSSAVLAEPSESMETNAQPGFYTFFISKTYKIKFIFSDSSCFILKEKTNTVYIVSFIGILLDIQVPKI